MAQQYNQQIPKIVGTGAVGSAQQGQSVAISNDGNTAIVGGPSDNGGAGAVWVFTRNGNIWTQQGSKLAGTGALGDAAQGTSVALSADGNTAVVGGPNDNAGAGAAWVFTRSGGVWTQQGAKLVGTGAVGNAGQGTSVSGNGTTIIVGGPNDSGGMGAAWLFTVSGGVWTQQGAKLVGSGATGVCSINQGSSVALSQDGSTAIVGGPGDNNRTCLPESGVGAAWVFTQAGGVWIQQGSKLVNSATNLSAAGNFDQGYSVALSANGNTAAVGGLAGGGLMIGDAGIFVRSGGVWSQQGGALDCANGGSAGLVGTAPCIVTLSADGSTAVFGGSGFDEGPGAALIFTQAGGVWTQQAALVGKCAVGTFFSKSVAASANGTTVLVGAPSDSSKAGATWAFGPGNSASATHDFNGDGRSDILWRDQIGDVGMWLMNGASVESAGAISSVSTNWSVVGQRDFACSGDAGILWRDTAGDTDMWLMNGNQIASMTELGNVTTAWSVVGTGDFNADGYADILWRDTSGNPGIWFMNGTKITQTNVVGNMPLTWIVAGSDMHGDIFWRNTMTGDVAMWVMNGPTVAQSVNFGSVPLTWNIAGIGDFDGNGSFDILWRDTSGNVGIWLMNGTQIISTAVLGNVPLNWAIAQTGDYGGVGRSGILWVDSVGDLGAWFMNGTTISSVASYGNVATSWTVQSLNAD